MDTRARFSVSIEKELVSGLNKFVKRCGFSNRSQALSKIIVDRLTESAEESPRTPIIGTITLMYNHHKRNLTETLTEIQHHYIKIIRSSLHIHVNHDFCMEVLAVEGPYSQVRELADSLLTTKGLGHGKLAVTAIK